MRAFYASEISEHIAQTPEGFLICRSIPIARDGIQIYKASELALPNMGGDERIRVLRPASEVFSDATIASFEGKPFVSPHPPMFVTAENIAGYQKGHIQNVREGQPLPDGTRILVADVVVTDASLISQILAKTMRELSCGYDCVYEPISDEYDPTAQYAQTMIRGNHLALVPNGRAGEAIRILDSQPEPKEGFTMEIKALREAIADFKEVMSFVGLGSGAKTSATQDADPGAVERNEQKNAEALERAKMRNRDEDPDKDKEKKEGKDEGGGKKEMEKEEAGASKPKESPDAAATRDSIDTLTRTVARLADAIDADRKSRDAAEKEEEKKEMKKEEKDESKKEEEEEKKESKDSELIPVPTLTGKEVPKNPIPGATEHVDRTTVDALLAIKPAIAAAVQADPVQFRDAAVKWNDAYTRATGGKVSDQSYRNMTDIKKPDVVVNGPQRTGGTVVHDTASDSADYASEMKKFHRVSPASVMNEKARVN